MPKPSEQLKANSQAAKGTLTLVTPHTDTERLDQLQKLRRRRDELHEFWFDPDAELFWAGDQGGDDLRAALDNLLFEESGCPK